MKKELKKEKKLFLKKLQITKIKNPGAVLGGGGGGPQNINDCTDPNEASNHQGGFDTGR